MAKKVKQIVARKRKNKKKKYLKPGQPEIEFLQSYCDEARAYCCLGYTDVKLAEVFGISLRTLNNWKHRHPEFLHSIKEGKDKADAIVAETLFDKAQNGDMQAISMWLKNRQPELWNRVSLKIQRPPGKDGKDNDEIIPIVGLIINP